jgi:hypothetical protein
MAENPSSAMEPPRAADVMTQTDTKSEFVARENCLLEQGLTLRSSWSFVERLYALPF